MMNISKKPSNNIFLSLPKNKKEELLLKALHKDNLMIVKKLINSGCTHSYYELSEAVKFGAINTVKFFIEHLNYDINLEFPNGYTLLTYACRFSYSNLVKYLIDKGADVKPPSNHEPYIILAVSNSDISDKVIKNKKEIILLLLDKGVDINEMYNETNVLIEAAFFNNYSIVELLLKHKANPNVQDKNNDTPLHYASDNGNIKMVELLLKHKADPNIQDKGDETPLHAASEHGHTEIVELLKKYTDKDF